MKHNTPHIGATVRCTRTGVVGKLDWLELPIFGRLAVIVDSKGVHHKVGYRHLTVLEPRRERLAVSLQRLNGHHAPEGYGVTTAPYAECWLEPKVLEVAA